MRVKIGGILLLVAGFIAFTGFREWPVTSALVGLTFLFFSALLLTPLRSPRR